MAQSQLNLYNLALSIISDKYIVATTGEASIPAETCGMWYDVVRQTVLRSAHWNSCRRFARLTQEAARDTALDWVAADPNPGWAFSYDFPADMLAARYMTNFAEFDVGYDNDGKVINSNVGGTATADKPVLCYTADITDPLIWEPDLYKGMSFALAAHIAMPLTGKSGSARSWLEVANGVILEARVASANERQQLIRTMPESLLARGYTDQNTTVPFFYPYGPSFSASGAPLT